MVRKSSEQVTEIRKDMRGGRGEIAIRHYLKKEEINARCRLCAQLIIPPGASIGLHEHIDEDEIFIIQQGQGLVTDGGRQIEIETGDAILTGKSASHDIKNTGNNDLIVTAIIMQY